MIRNSLSSSYALGATLLLALPGGLQAQSTNYAPVVTQLPVHVGQPFTVTLSVPSTVPDGTAFSALIIPSAGRNYSQVFTASVNHTATFQVPALAAAGTYQIQASQMQGSASVGVVSPLALNPGVLQLIVSPAGQSPSPLATFTGQYSFLFKGQANSAPGVPNGFAAAGILTSDGNGHITAGTLDLNSASGYTLQGVATTGIYQLDGTGKGVLALTTPQGTVNLNFYVPPGQPGVQVTQGSLALSGGYTGSGAISTAAPFLRNSDFYPANQFEQPPNFLTSVRFFDEPVGSSGFAAGLGQLSFTYNGSISGAGVVVAALPDVFTGTMGTYTPLAGPENGNAGPAPGRFTLTLSAPGQPVTTPTHYAVYPGMDGTQPVLYLLSLDSHSSTDLVVGTVTR